MFSTKRSLRYNLIYWIFLIVFAGFAVFGLFQYVRAEKSERSAQNSYSRAFYELSDSMREIDALLEKIMLSQNPTQISALASDIYAQTESAKASLSQLPFESGTLVSASKFLSQAGDYTAYISAKVTDSGEITNEEFNNLLSLAKHAEIMDDALEEYTEHLSEGEFSFDKPKSNSVYADGEGYNFLDGMAKIEKDFVNYPSLIYDGPFSEHLEKTIPEATKNLDTISESEALEIAKMYLKGERATSLSLSGETASNPESYIFSSNAVDRQVSIQITKKGGLGVWFLDNRNVENENLSIEEAKNHAFRYLRSLGFNNMIESYYEKNSGTLTINYAFVQNDIVMYSDLIKLKVALDNGEIIGFEAKGYIMSHKIREIPENIISQKEAYLKLSSHLTPTSVRLAFIPKESKREVLCYEFSGEFNGKNFLIYINAETGKDEKILMLIKSENGVLTI